MTDGICILANDVVYDQLIALLNSLEVNAGKAYPVLVIPYDERTAQVEQLIEQRPNVELFKETAIISRWEKFAEQIWQRHPTAYQKWTQRGIQGVNRLGMHRRFCGFDGPFDRFLYLDADILVLGALAPLFEQLEQGDISVYDFQYKDLSHVFDVTSAKLTQVFETSKLSRDIFCAGLYASKQGLFDRGRRDWLLEQLDQDAEILYTNGPDQSILNYMMLKTGLTVCNLAQQPPAETRTGCCITSPHFEQRDYRLYDRGQPLTYLHYIGLSSQYFRRLCQGENLTFPYRDLFLHYRYLQDPAAQPVFSGHSQQCPPRPPGLGQKILKKLRLMPARRA
ncbi:MAG: sugar transferase [Leptolyngbyaceae cyanobacterium SL_1_1]|nr:sugar transferase [Leptolyngbyaceae cyanobacterium RM2_2_21]NJN02831.1 sugar transferase [Leptolyngbyaceae cyanobacterium RM1_1_2]NJO11602.1 sugar transferase [Leptolyngbyaceae cyanobacterium SL_1_1]